MDKGKGFSLKKFIKLETSKPTRLQSLKLPRDLTLGGTKKKVFTPNLNVARKKDQPKEVKKSDAKKRQNNHVHVRTKKISSNNNQRYVQSTGVFSEGSGEFKRSLYRSERSINSKENDSISSMTVPTVNHNAWSINKNTEEGVLGKLVTCDNKEDEDIKTNLEPLELGNKVELNKIKLLQLKLKKEKGVGNAAQSYFSHGRSKLKLEENSVLPIPFADEKMHNDNHPALTVFRLPHSFAGKGLSDNPDDMTLFDYPLSAMLDGQVGKLCIRRSGKIEMHIGKAKYDLEDYNLFLGTSEVVNYSQKDVEHLDAGVTVLGDVKNWFTLVPAWKILL